MAGFYENYQRTYKDYISAVAATQAGAAGTAVAVLSTIPQGFLARLVRYSVFSNSSANPTFELFVASYGEWLSPNFAFDRTRRLDYTAQGRSNVSDNINPPVFDEGEVPMFAWTGGNNGDICQAAVQIALYQKVPMLSSLDHRMLAEQETNETGQRKDSVVVGGSGWNVGVYEADDLAANAFTPWTERGPGTDNPAEFDLPMPGTYVGGNAQGSQHPRPPFDGRILPDGSTDKSGVG